MKKTIKEEDFYKCKRCKISSDTKYGMCPCPRGGCEAKITGTKTITTIITFNRILSATQKIWNKSRL